MARLEPKRQDSKRREARDSAQRRDSGRRAALFRGVVGRVFSMIFRRGSQVVGRLGRAARAWRSDVVQSRMLYSLVNLSVWNFSGVHQWVSHKPNHLLVGRPQ